MADGLLQPRIGGLYHGVSRQAPLQRSPNQLQELDNFLPSVDLGGISDRSGSRAVFAVPRGLHTQGNHHFFRTSDGQRWVCLKRLENGLLDVYNITTGAKATVSYGPWVSNYIGVSAGLKFLTLSDTTFILNPDVTVTLTEQTMPARTTGYVVVKRISSASQSYNVSTSVGTANEYLAQNASNTMTRDTVAINLTAKLNVLPGVSATRIVGGVVRVTASTAIIDSLTASNDWDESAIQAIKGRVNTISDLPARFESNVPMMVDTGFGDLKASYYVMYDAALNVYVECSYLPNKATTAALDPGTMPVRLRQNGTNSFELQPCDWVARKTGDSNSNPKPAFVGKRITAFAQWKGRLWLGSDDTIVGSQPDDLFNFFRGSARQSAPSDPVALVAESPDLGLLRHLVAFRDKLMVMSDTTQLEVPGDKPITPDDATIGVATRYQLDKDCVPTVIGDSLYYTGVSEGRAALWEYGYDFNTANNTAFDLSKHIPGYVPGRVSRIRGSSQAGRTFIWTPKDPTRLYVHTGYWKDQQRAQNAWSRLTFPYATSIADHWVYEDTLYVLVFTAGFLWVCTMPVDTNIGDVPADDMRLDFNTRLQITWSVARNRSEVIIPTGFMDLNPNLVILVDRGDLWFHENPVTCVWDGTQWVGHFPQNYGVTFGNLGVRYTRSMTFSPFYPSAGESTTPIGRLQVHNVIVDALVSCDFTATVTRKDRTPTTVSRSPRVVGGALVPDKGYNLQHRLPFNAKGDQATLTLSTTSTGPITLTGFTLTGRYTNATTP